MGLLVAYLVCLVVGQAITIGIGLSIDRYYPATVSLPISLFLYFTMFWVAWKIAVPVGGLSTGCGTGATGCCGFVTCGAPRERSRHTLPRG